MKIIENNVITEKKTCWKCKSVLELIPSDYKTKKIENVDGPDEYRHFSVRTYFVCPCCGTKNYKSIFIDGRSIDTRWFNS